MAEDLELAVRLKADGSGLVGEVRVSKQQLDKLKDSLNDSERAGERAGRGFDRAGTGARRFTDNARGLFRQLFSLKGLLATLGLGVLARSIVSTVVEFERFQASLVTVTGSANIANSEFERLKQFATETPFQLQEVVGGFIKLKALGLDPSIEALRSYGNTASAMGKSLNQFIESVADAATGEFERLKEFGIKARQQADTVTFTFRGASTAIGKDAAAIEGFLRDIGNVEFAGAMQQQMDTLGGALSNLKDATEQLEAALGEAGLSDALKKAARGMTAFANETRLAADEGEGFFASITGGLAGMLADLGVEQFMSATQQLEVLREREQALIADLRQMEQGSTSFLNRLFGLPSDRDLLIRQLGDVQAQILELEVEEFFTFPRAEFKTAADGIIQDILGITEASSEQNDVVKELTKSQKALVDALFPADRAFKEYADALNELSKIQKTLGWTDDQYQDAVDRLTEAYLDLDDATADVADSTTKLKDAADPIAQIYEDTASSIRTSFRDTFREIIDEGIDGFKGLVLRIKDVFKDMLADLATLAIARPVIVPVVGALGGLLGVSPSAQAGVLGQLGGAANGAGGIVGGIGQFGSAASTFFSGGGLSALGATGLAGLGGGALGFGLTGSAAGGIGGALGGAAGFTGGVLLASGSSALSAAALGATFGSVVPIIGTAIGAIAGSLIGDKLFGGSKPDKSKIQFFTADEGANFAGVQGGISATKTSPFGTVGLTAFSNNLRGATDSLLTAVTQIDQSIAQLLTPSQIDQVSAALTGGGVLAGQAFNVVSFDNELFDVAKNRLTTVIDTLAGNSVAAQILNDVPRGQENVDALIQSAAEIIKLVEFFTDAGEEMNAAEQAIANLNTQFDQLAQAAERLGFSVDEVEGKRADALRQLTEDADESVRLQILRILDPQQAAFEELQRIQDLQLGEFKALGANLGQVAELFALQRDQLVQAANQDRLNAVSNLRDFVNGLGLSDVSPLSGRERFDLSLSQFNDAIALSRNGDVSAIESVPGLAQSLLQERLSAFAGVDFGNFFKDINRQLQDVLSLNDSTSNPVVKQLRDNSNQDTQNTLLVVNELRELKAEVAALRDDNARLNDALERMQARSVA